MNATVTQDMHFAVSVYQEAILAERHERWGKLTKTIGEVGAKAEMALSTEVAAARQLQGAENTLPSNAGQSSKQFAGIVAASEQAYANVQTVACAAEELASSVSEISRQDAESKKPAAQAVEQANRRNTEVRSQNCDNLELHQNNVCDECIPMHTHIAAIMGLRKPRGTLGREPEPSARSGPGVILCALQQRKPLEFRVHLRRTMLPFLFTPVMHGGL